MLLDLYYWIVGQPKRPPGYYARFKYLVTLSRYELVEASLPVFIAAGISGSASGIIDWNENFEDDSPDSMFVGTGFTFIFTSLVLGVVTLLQIDDAMPEDISDEICVPVPEPAEVTASYLSNAQFGFERQSREGRASNNNNGNENNIVVNPLGNPSTQFRAGNFELDNVALSTPSASTVTSTRHPHPCFEALCDRDSASNCVFMWNEFLGYLAGVSFYILVLVICEFDFKYKVVPALLVALLVTYNGPNFLAKLRITAEEAVAKKNGEVLYGVDPNNTNIANTTRNANQGENAPGAETTNRAGKYCSGGWCGALMHSYSEMNLKRKGVMMVAVRLTVGWVWETVLVYLYDLMEGSEDLEPYQKVLVEVSFATVIVSIVLCVHLYVRDWAEEGGAEETQRLQVAVQEIRESSLEVDVAAT
eukprot:gene7762-9270_t